MACIFKNSQGYKIKQTKTFDLYSFPYGFSPIIFVTLHIKTIENIIYVLFEAILNSN